MSIIKINNFQIINDGQELAIDVETALGSNITSILLWDIDTFKDYSIAKSLNYKLEQINNKEIFIVTAEELNLYSFKDIYFIEVESNYVDTDGCSTCENPTLGITYNLQPYYKCMLNYLLESEINYNVNKTDVLLNNLTINTSLLIDAIEKSIEIGYYLQAIEILNQLKKICNITKCKNCETIQCNSCSKFKQI